MKHLKVRFGFTLVELLVVITIIGILISLLLPAVQSAREAGRRLQCQNNLKQIALACLSHEQAQGFFPSAGWGWAWTGDPDRGFGRTQSGGWAYSILPYLEQQPLHNMGAGKSDTEKLSFFADAAGVAVPVFYCPTRRPAASTPKRPYSLATYGLTPGGQMCYNANNIDNISGKLARSDYAGNGGDTLVGWGSGPTPSQGLAGQGFADMSDCTGIFHQRSTISVADVRDGLSNTYLAGEKYISANHYADGLDYSDDQSCWMGDDWDMQKWTRHNPSSPQDDLLPLQDREGVSCPYQFGSVHTAGFQAALCDGSVRMISYLIDAETHRCLGNRKDGQPVDGSKL